MGILRAAKGLGADLNQKALDAFVLIYPLYTVMFVAHGLTPVQVSATLMAWSITAFILQIPSGVLADRYSRRWILAGAQVLRVIGLLVWIASPRGSFTLAV